MTIITTSPLLKGRCTKLAHALYGGVSLLRLIGILYIIVGVVMIRRDGVLQHATFPLLNQFVVHGMPLGNFSSGLVYGLFFMFPLHTIFGILGFMGVVCQNKLLIVIFTCFLMFGTVMDVMFIMLFSLILDGINSWIKWRFLAYYQDYTSTPTRLNPEVEQAFKELFDAMNCKVAESTPYGPVGCWDKYYPVMNGIIRIFIMLLAFNIVLEITSIVMLELIYRRVGRESHQSRSKGMFEQFFHFILTSVKTNTSKCVFAVFQFTDVVISALLLFGGVVISQSRFVTDSRLIPIFENMRFNGYYLPGIVLGLAVTMIVIGCLNGISSGIGCIMLCFKSDAKTKVILTWQVLMIILFLIGLCFWIYLLRVVYEGMFYQLYWEFLVYGGTTYIQMYYTRAWNALFVTYSCCSVGDIGNFRHTHYLQFFQEYIPTYCRSGATIANSDLDTITVPPRKSVYVDYYTTVCETPLKTEIQNYQIFFGVVSGIALFLKMLNMIVLWKFGFDSASVGIKASWETFKEFIKNNRFMVLGLAIFTVFGLLISCGILITGVRLYFDDILGHKDIKVLFEYIYIFGRDVTSWVAIMSKGLISIGCVSFVIFSVAILSAYSKDARVYYMAVLALIISLLFKLISIFLWIPLRVSFDWNLRGELYSALHAYYQTDNPYPDVYLYIGDKNLGFNTLFYQGKCCLQQSSVFDDLTGSMSGNVPWTCRHCQNDMGVRWPLSLDARNLCPSSAYTEDCTTTILDNTLHRYDTTAVIFSAIMIALEVLLVIGLDRAFKSRVVPEKNTGLFSHLLLNNRFINEERMPKYTHIALALCLFKLVTLLMQLLFTVGIIMEKINPGYFDNTEDFFLNDVFSWDISLGYVTHALGLLLLTVTLTCVVLNIAIIAAVLRRQKNVLLGLSLVTIVFGTLNFVILGFLCQVLDVAYCCDKSPNCSYRTDVDADTFQQFCTKTYSNDIHKVIGVSIAYVITIISLQIVCVVLSDRLYKRLQDQKDPENEASGIFTTVWKSATDNRFINKKRMPNYTNLVAVFIMLKGTTMVSEVAVSIGIILEKFSPEYFNTTEKFYLNNIYSGDLTLGYVTHVTGIVMFCVIVLFVGLGGLGVFAVINGRRVLISIVVILTLVLALVEVICLGLLSLVLSVAYCCDYGTACTFYTSASAGSIENMCRHGFQGAVFNVIGTFIGFMVGHLVTQVVVICLLDRIYKRMSADDDAPYGLFETFGKLFVTNRFINETTMPNFTLMAVLYVIGNSLLGIIDISAWIAILVYVIKGDSQVDQMYVGTLYLGEMTRGASITLLVVIPFTLASNLCKIVWFFRKWNTGLKWSTLPDTLRLIVDIVILGLYAQLLESVRLSDRNIYRVVYVLTLAYVCFNIAAQIALFVLKDRLHKQIESSLSITDYSGMITRLWGEVVRRFRTDSGQINKSALGFCSLSCFLVVWETALWVAVLLQVAEKPGYLHGTFRTELGLEYNDDYFWRILVTVLVMGLVIAVFHIITTVIVVYVVNKQRKAFLYIVCGLLGCILVSDIVTTGLASEWLNKAYTCLSSSKFCSTHVSRLYELCGVFIGLNITHLCLVGVLLGLCIYVIYTFTNSTTVSPVDEIALRSGQKGAITTNSTEPTGSVLESLSDVSL